MLTNFHYLDVHEDLRGAATGSFVVASLYTQSHELKARTLAESCRKAGLPCALFRVPTVHRSISANGTGDLRFTKANMVNFALEKYGVPVLHVDADCFFYEFPVGVENLVRERRDFAIYNWLADSENDAYLPIALNVTDPSGKPVAAKNRFYAYSHSVDYSSDDQLLCSGAVQLYGPSESARRLLALWQEAISKFAGACDDHCLDFAFNNHPSLASELTYAWLDKSCARYPWWIHARPVICHPDVPATAKGFVDIDAGERQRRIYMERTQARTTPNVFPKDCIIDAQERLLLKLEENRLTPVGRVERELWL